MDEGTVVGATPPAVPAADRVQHSTYSLLVEDDDDLIGHVAYALYKREKLKFCEAYVRKHNREPDVAALQTFIDGCNLDTRLRSYRSEAELLLGAMSEYQLEEAVKEIREDAKDDVIRQLKEAKSWRRLAGEGVFQSLVTAAFWAVLVLILYAGLVGPKQVLEDIQTRASPPQLTAPKPAPSNN
ncbi:MAG: hypothetical protein WCS09_02920 [Pseudomonadota bacterium]|jgi:hypothetical protein